MSSYFDALSREVAEAADQFESTDLFVAAVSVIEHKLYDDVTRITGDREFPDDLRNRMLGVLAREAVYQPGTLLAPEWAVERVGGGRWSRAIESMHELFHELASRHVTTRFGRLSDNPVAMRTNRDAHDGGA